MSIVIDDIKVTVIRREMKLSTSEWYKTTRVYGAPDALAADLLELEPFQGVSIPYTQETDAERVMAKTWAAWRNSTTKVVTERLRPILVGLADHLEMGSALSSIKFSQKAGCSCPCSPGFVLGDRVLINGTTPVDIWLDKNE
jgi:hypothetical protein